MTGRPRHGLHVVREDGEPGGTAAAPLPRRASLTLSQQSVVLTLQGQLNADTAGRLGLHLLVFTEPGVPQELVLDLSGVHLVDEAGLQPIHDADEAMSMRSGTLRLVELSAAVSHLLADLRRAETELHGVTALVRHLPADGDAPGGTGPDGPAE